MKTKPSVRQLSTVIGLLPIEFYIPCSASDTTLLTVGAAKATFRIPVSFTLREIRATLATASSLGLPVINIRKNGVTIFSTELTINQTEKSSRTATTPYVLTANPTFFNNDDEIQIDVNTAGTGAAGLRIWFIGIRN